MIVRKRCTTIDRKDLEKNIDNEILISSSTAKPCFVLQDVLVKKLCIKILYIMVSMAVIFSTILSSVCFSVLSSDNEPLIQTNQINNKLLNICMKLSFISNHIRFMINKSSIKVKHRFCLLYDQARS